MSYQVLARKWRPASFAQMVGQSHVLHALTNALSQQRLHHAYLFTGTRGVGKTSLARLFAKGLNCEQGITATPCGQCSACQEIAQGRFVDLIEVDAASRTKVDDTRELLDNVQYRPSRGRFKVYLIDEVHMLSRSSFNALLKTLEEPPEHVKFLLATTDPQKLPVTVLSRCLQFNLKSLSQQEIATQLQHIVTQEQFPCEAEALRLLAKAANGSMRDALSLTDQAIAFGAGQITLTQVQQMLGAIDERQVLSLLQALVAGDIAALLQQVEQVLAFGADADEVLRSLLELLHQIVLSQFAPAAAQLSLYSSQIQTFASALSAEQVQLYYQLLLTGRKDLPLAPDPKSGLEMALLRAVAFVPETPPKRWGQPADMANPHPIPLVHNATAASSSPAAVAPVIRAAPLGRETQVPTPAEAPALAITRPAAPVSASVAAVATATPAQATAMDDALAAEQALILSQASSMGYQPDDFAAAAQTEPMFKDTLTQEMFADVAESATDAEKSITADMAPLATNAAADEHAPADTGEGLFGDDVLDSVLSIRQQLQQDVAALADSDAPSGLSLPSDASHQHKAVAEKKPDTDTEAASTAAALAPWAGDDADALAAADDMQDNADDALPVVDEAFALDADDGTLQAGVDFSLADDDESLSAMALMDAADAVNSQQYQQWLASQTTAFSPALAGNELPAVDSSVDLHVESSVGTNAAPMAVSTAAIQPSYLRENVLHAVPGAASTAEPPLASVPAVTPAAASATDTSNLAALSPALPAISGLPADLGWYKLVSTLPVRGRVRQLAANTLCLAMGSEGHLLLKPDQKHLAAAAAVQQLQQVLSDALQQPLTLSIDVGIDNSRETPQEIRQRFKQELLQHSAQQLQADANVQWLAQHMGAQLDTDSLVYTNELLNEKTAQIADGLLPQ